MPPRRRLPTRRAALPILPFLLSGLLAPAGNARAQPAPIRVGSKNFTEQFVVAEIYAQALEAAGARVERRLNLGGTLIAQRALESGQIDLYPEYTGTALTVVLRRPVEPGAGADRPALLRRLREFYERQFGATWLDPSGIDNGNVLLVRPALAQRLGLRTLSDLAAVSAGLTLAAGNEFADRADGLPGLERVYGMRFAYFRQFAALGLRYAALRHGQADVVNGYATDWQIAADGLLALEDDRHLFPPYDLAPVVRLDALARFPPLRGRLDAVNARLDTAGMRALNRAVEYDGDEPADVARRFLREQGLTRERGN
nr:glycine betaine ABC transporter substrate-binding protein [Roseomonas acroporae]